MPVDRLPFNDEKLTEAAREGGRQGGTNIPVRYEMTLYIVISLLDSIELLMRILRTIHTSVNCFTLLYIRTLRLANSACCNLVTKRLFLRTHLTFSANTLTKASRFEALSRNGHHIEHLTFSFPHSPATFLPPLIHPQTGEEVCFLYSPQTSTESGQTRAKYSDSELGEILTQQYPPLFHAATHVPSFIAALT
ncbi:hypothetical protein B0J18DRAFT_485686 [Chaetomium sp. MPI-SDFR-AT-0129]|nr:hypothetical protein B0J18DRAFT_485686 [Chaetomium sp. MPI-SDFR-AT-0129]